MFSWRIVWIGTVAFLSQTGQVTSHGRLIQPAQRSSAWRFGYDIPENYNDNELSCGGAGVQWNAVNDGRCGVCGDPFNAAIKPNEDINGKYVKNDVITGTYVKGDVLASKVDITAYHKGWFEFRLCPLATPTTKVTQACLNQTLLRVAGSSTSRIILADINNGKGVQVYEINLQLPSTVTCERCVLQWKYNTGNSWGCESKGCCIGCGKQENFVNCADIKITDVQTTTESSSSSSSSSQSATMTALTSSTTMQKSTSSVKSSTSTSTTSQATTLTSTTTSSSAVTTSSTPSTTSSTSSVVTSSTTSSTSTATSSDTTSSTTSSTPSKTPSTSPVAKSSVTTSSTTNTDSTSSTNSKLSSTTLSPTSATSTEGNLYTVCSSSLSCTAVAPFSDAPGMIEWCCNNCLRGFCPSSHCLCSDS